MPFPSTYRESGMRGERVPVDSANVNVHGTMPTVWVKTMMLALNLLVWLDAAARVAG